MGFGFLGTVFRLLGAVFSGFRFLGTVFRTRFVELRILEHGFLSSRLLDGFLGYGFGDRNMAFRDSC